MESLHPKALFSLFQGLWSNLTLKFIFATLAIVLNWTFGADIVYLYSIGALILIDTITGTMLACKTQHLSSYGFYRFSTKVLVYFLLCATAKLIDRVLPVEMAHSIMFSFLGITEGLSILENISALGFPVPKLVYRYMKIFNEDPIDKGGK